MGSELVERRNGVRYKSPDGERLRKTCSFCGRQFVVWPSKATAQYCSRECQYQARRRRVEVSCERCGASFLVKESQRKAGGGRFCSRICANASMKRRVLMQCEDCGREFEVRLSTVRSSRGRFCSRSCARRAQRIASRQTVPWSFERWDEGRPTSDGRITVYLPDHHRAHRSGYVFRSIVVYEMVTGDVVDWPEFLVHHVNHDPTDDRPENLVKMKAGDHVVHHRAKPIDEMTVLVICEWCGAKFRASVHQRKRGRHRFCSKSCAGKYAAERHWHRDSVPALVAG